MYFLFVVKGGDFTPKGLLQEASDTSGAGTVLCRGEERRPLPTEPQAEANLSEGCF